MAGKIKRCDRKSPGGEILKGTRLKGPPSWRTLEYQCMLYLILQAYSSNAECQKPPLITWLKPSKTLFQAKLIWFGEVNCVEKRWIWFENSTCGHTVGFAMRWVSSHISVRSGMEGRRKHADLRRAEKGYEWEVVKQGVPGRLISPDVYPLDYQKSHVNYTVSVFSHA